MTESVTFNLTDRGREILKSLAAEYGVSEGDVIENLVLGYEGPALSLKICKLPSGKKGGAPCLFKGKTRGKTTAVCIREVGKAALDNQVKLAEISRGDWLEILLRLKVHESFDNPRLDLIFLSEIRPVACVV